MNEKKEKDDNQTPLRENLGKAADVIADSARQVNRSAKAVGESIPYVGKISRAATVVSDAAKDTEYGFGESLVCNGLKNVVEVGAGAGVVTWGLVRGAAVGGLAAGGPVPNPYVKGAGAIIGGLTGAKLASDAVAPIVKPLGEVTRNVCHATFGWLNGRNMPASPKAEQKQAAQQQASTNTARYQATNLHSKNTSFQQFICTSNQFNLSYQPRYFAFNNLSMMTWSAQQQAVREFQLRYGFMSPSIESAIYREVSLSTSSWNSAYFQTSGLADFSHVLMATNLVSSFNAYNIVNRVYSQMEASGEIGGVASEVSLIENLLNSEAHAVTDHFYLCFPEDKMSVSDEWFNQVQHELYNAYHKEKTLPIFSLHINQKGFNYPVLPKALQDTSVGRLIGFLDFWLKGYLNGGIFDEAFLERWHEQENCDDAFLRANMIDLKKYCKEKMPGLAYISLRELESRYGVQYKSSDSAYQQPFMTSFRIISILPKIETIDNILLPHPDIRIEYSVELMPDYKQYVDSYLLEHGKYPPEYESNLRCYELFAQEVAEKMPQLQFCKELFKRLGIITVLSYLYVTFEKMGKLPQLPPLKEAAIHPHFPKSLPPIPVRHFQTYPLSIQFNEILERFRQTEGREQSDQLFSELFRFKKAEALPNGIAEKMQASVISLIKEKLSPKLPQGEAVEINEDESERITKAASDYLVNNIRQLHSIIEKAANKMAAGLTREQQAMAKEKALASRIEYVIGAITQKQAILEAEWKKDPRKAQDGILAVIPEDALVKDKEGKLISLRASIRDNFKAIQQNLDTTKQAAISEIKQKSESSLADDLAELSKAYEAGLLANKERHEKQAAEAFSQQITALKDLIIKQLEEAIKKIEANKKAQFDAVPVHLRAANEVQITAFIKGENDRIEGIRQSIEQVKLEASETVPGTSPNPEEAIQLLRTRKTELAALINPQVEKFIKEDSEKLKEKYDEEIIKCKQHYTNLNQEQAKNIEAAVAEDVISACYQEALGQLGYYFAHEIKRLTSYLQNIQHLIDCLLSHKEIAENPVSKQYTHSFVSFTSSDLTRKYFGGCAPELPNIKAAPLLHGELFAESLSAAFKAGRQDKVSFQFQGQSYIAYRLRAKDSELVLADSEENEALDTLAVEAINRINNDAAQAVHLSQESLKTIVDSNCATLMHYAAASLNPAILKTIFQANGIEVLRLADKAGNLPVHMAAQSGHVEALRLMLGIAPDLVNAKNKRGLTPLMLAVQHGKQEVMEALQLAGADFNYALPNGLFPLFMAFQKNFRSLALWMMEHVPGLDLNQMIDSRMTSLHLAIQGGEIEAAKELVRRKARPDIRRKSDGYTAFHCAASQGEVELLQIMLAANPDLAVDMPLESKKTALHLAAQAEQLAAVQFLIGKGALIDAQNLEGETPLILAIKAGQLETAQWLAERAAVNQPNHKKQTASQLAIQYALPAVSDILFRRGEDYHAKDRNGFSSLYFLVRNGDYARVRQLLRKNVNFREMYEGNSLTAIAAQFGHFLIVYALLEKGVAYKTSSSLTLLDCAVMADEIGYLRDNLQEDNDMTALSLKAIQNRAFSCLEYLFKKGQKNSIQTSLLIAAAIESNDEKIASLVFRYCKDIDQPLDTERNYPVHIAIKTGAHRILPLLKERACQFASVNSRQQTAFHLAVKLDDAALLKRLFKLSLPSEWPKDLFVLEEVSADIRKLLSKYEKRQSPSREAAKSKGAPVQPSSAPSKPLPTPVLDKKGRKVIKKFKLHLQKLQFDKALSLFNKEKILLTAFKSTKGASLLQHLIANTYHLASLQAGEEGLALGNLDSSLEKLLAALKKDGVSPGLFKGDKNVLRAIINANDDATACYRFDVLVKYFPDRIADLISDKIRGLSMLQLASAKSHSLLFTKMDAVCRSAETSDHNGLHEAIKANKYELVKQLLPYYAVNRPNHKGQTALMFAAATGNVALMNLLLKEGARVDQVDLKGNSALHYALEKPSEAAALTLLPLMKTPNQSNRLGITPMMLAAAKESLPVLRYLCESGHSISSVDQSGNNALHYAAMLGKVKSIVYLARQGFDLNRPETPEETKKLEKSARRTALHLAALNGHVKAVLCLLELKADLEKEDKHGFGVCEYAIYSKNQEMLDFVKLIPLYHRKERNRSLLHAAVTKNNKNALAELILDDVDLNVLDKNGRSALHLACINDARDAAALLLKGGDLVLNDTDRLGYAPIHYAAQLNHVGLIELLAKAGANLNQPASGNGTALHLACQNGKMPAVLALIKHGADLNSINADGLTPAQTALGKGHFRIVRALVQARDKSISPASFAHLPKERNDELNRALSQYHAVSKVKEGLMMHSFYKSLHKPMQPSAEQSKTNVPS
ncbi:ankyrin repeat-containing protein [Legionella quinlivanii]|uniref:Ankyrin repeat-containing protein n=1 Tax=Legionella quinlivanii TaxID=45073 RepID=A0A0W0Y4F1_9GAMM|nr:ankyrin repeat domain-containing protein [Legionella quinlivanii]KTD51454.1 ankyrin repeat-containing protein [Legionella quinlivanii]SEG44987.1 Ankyrin repeat [Legionella quinlivanii DSM 21216]STY11021.1 ankyrin repeat-containing protein [Legionella quinlivanii]